jgi:hypothetical protein
MWIATSPRIKPSQTGSEYGEPCLPRIREPIIPFWAAVGPQPGRILGEQNGGDARAFAFLD